MKYIFVYTLLPLLLFSCKIVDKKTSKEMLSLWWVDGSRNVFMTKNPQEVNIEEHNWIPIQNRLIGFNPKGYMYKILVKEQDQENEKGMGTYTFVKVIEKKPIDTTIYKAIQGAWILDSIYGAILPLDDIKIEIDISKNRIQGSDGCNRLLGNIKNVDAYRFKVGMIASTKMLCPKDTYAYNMREYLYKINQYKVVDNRLVLMHNGLMLLGFSR